MELEPSGEWGGGQSWPEVGEMRPQGTGKGPWQDWVREALQHPTEKLGLSLEVIVSQT